MEKILKGLSILTAIFGVIGSIVIADYGGMVQSRYSSWYDRDYGMTFGIFLGCCLSVAIFSALLYGFAELLETQKETLEVQKNILEHISTAPSKAAVSPEKDTLQDIESNLPSM